MTVSRFYQSYVIQKSADICCPILSAIKSTDFVVRQLYSVNLQIKLCALKTAYLSVYCMYVKRHTGKENDM